MKVYTENRKGGGVSRKGEKMNEQISRREVLDMLHETRKRFIRYADEYNRRANEMADAGQFASATCDRDAASMWLRASFQVTMVARKVRGL